MFSYSDECWMKRALKYVKRMLPLFHAEGKVCSTNRLFMKNDYAGTKIKFHIIW